MLPDCIAYDTARTGQRQAGVFTGLWTAGETFGLALGPGIYALVLQLFGYVSSSSGTAAAQDDTARLGVLLGFTRAARADRRPGGAAAARLRPDRGAARRSQPWRRSRPAAPGSLPIMVAALPAHGVPAEQVLDEIRALRAADLPTHGGRLFAYVYDPAVPGLDDLAAAAHRLARRTSTGSTRPRSRRCWRWRTRSSARPPGCSAAGPAPPRRTSSAASPAAAPSR